MKMVWMMAEIKWVRVRVAALRTARDLAAFYTECPSVASLVMLLVLQSVDYLSHVAAVPKSPDQTPSDSRRNPEARELLIVCAPKSTTLAPLQGLFL